MMSRSRRRGIAREFCLEHAGSGSRVEFLCLGRSTDGDRYFHT
jgi:hypothetical protein